MFDAMCQVGYQLRVDRMSTIGSNVVPDKIMKELRDLWPDAEFKPFAEDVYIKLDEGDYLEAVFLFR